MEAIADSKKASIFTLAEFITVLDSDADCREATKSVGNRSTRFNINIDGVLLRVSPLDGTSRRVPPASLRLRFLHLC